MAGSSSIDDALRRLAAALRLLDESVERRLEEANREVSRRLVAAMETIREVLARQSA